MKRRIILTRPEEQSRAIASFLAGESFWIWPAFEFSCPKNFDAVVRRLSRLDDVDAILLVSPTAVSFAKEALSVIPKNMTVYAAGRATATAIRSAWGENLNLIYPEGSTDKSGSEALFSLMEEKGFPRHLLILRAQEGREWLTEKLTALGHTVEKMCIYEKTPFTLDTHKKEVLLQALGEETPVTLITSTDAVAVFERALSSLAGAVDWLKAGTALTIHPRIQEALRKAGFRDVRMSATSDPENLAKVLSEIPLE